ncbi:MAG: hypothetical protein Q9170_005917 [Blastenia crenularia]
MSPTKKGRGERGYDAGAHPLESFNEEEGEEGFPSRLRPMNTRSRTLPLRSLPTASNPFNTTSAFAAQTHDLPPSSPGKSSRWSPSKSPSRSRPPSPSKTTYSRDIVKREQLAQMSPSVDFGGIGLIKEKLVPKAVVELWMEYLMSAINEHKVVPKELQAELESKYNTPMKTQGPIVEWSYATGLFDTADIWGVQDTVKAVVKAAHEERRSHEPQWVSKVITPIMARLSTLSSSVSAKGRAICDLNISSVPIAPASLCPTSLVNEFKDVNKKVDYALALALGHEEERILQSAVTKYHVPGGTSINQTHDWTAIKPMFANSEVKAAGQDPLIQMAVWNCADFEKQDCEGYSAGLPILSIAIENDHWYLWIAYSVKLAAKDQLPGGKRYRVQFLGPVGMGYTGDAMGVFKIFHVLKAIVRWGLEVYEPRFMKHVFARYKNK